MKILSIRLKNLASIEGCFTVDFTAKPLATAGIFAISGPTGAGKSTILDALCLALYDKTPRFAASSENLLLKDAGDSRINQSDVRNILRRGAGEGFAEVVFVGIDGHRYKSTWSVRRARYQPTGSLQAQAICVVNPDTGEELQGTKTEILSRLATLVGLTYEQFTRTVLLAQNDFATFLKSREAAKAELLEKLTGTEIYSQISRTIFVRSKHAMEELNLLKSSISLIELLPKEEAGQLQADSLLLGEERAAAVKQLAVLNEQLKVIASLKAQQGLLNKKRGEAGTLADLLQREQALYAEKRENLTVFKQQCEALQPELRKAMELDVRIRAVQANDGQAGQRYLAARTKKEEALRQLDQRQKTLAETLQKLNADPALTSATLSCEEKINRAMLMLADYEEKINAGMQADEEQIALLNTFGIQMLSEEHSKLQREQQRLQAARRLTEAWITQTREAERLARELEEQGLVKAGAAGETASLKAQLEPKDEQLKALQRIYDNARLTMAKDVTAIRSSLEAGQPCPVCGAKAHPYATAGAAINSIYYNIEAEYKAAAEQHRQLNNRCITAEEKLRLLEEGYALLAARAAAIRQEVEQGRPEKEEERTTEHFDRLQERLQQQIDELDGKMKAYYQLQDKRQANNAQTNNLRRQADAMRNNITACRLLHQQVAADSEQATALSAHAAEEQARLTNIHSELEQLRRERAALLKGKTVADAEAAVQRHEKELNGELETARLALERQTAAHSILQGEIKQLVSTVEQLDKEQQHIQSPELLPDRIAGQQAANSAIERKLSAMEARLLQQKQNEAKLKEIEQELHTKQSIAEQWEKLNKLIGSADGAKFKIIAQSYTLNLLIMHANKHLAYLSKRYRLQQVPDTLALQVIDCDMCDEVRTVYSLSGGESFLISLALALALSSLSGNNLKVESLFIDEGFGSLDADSLRTAMEALERLQLQGRKIGVISHVQEMSEHISVQIHVRKSANGKSEIIIN
ncbi:MAG: AAA family ATPase [Mediterranea sp.]|jgi:exonuclease SbcC|nr:AAA family ATPase [Mediterranea sp.]